MMHLQTRLNRPSLAAWLMLCVSFAAAFQLISNRSDADTRTPAPTAKPAPASTMVMQTAGRGRLEAHPPGNVDGVRFEGRFVIWGMRDARGQVFGDDASLFDSDCVAQHGRGPQCAHLVAVRSGSIVEGFTTGSTDGDLAGETMGRTSAASRMRIYYDAHPDGTRDFETRDGWFKGKLVATYSSDEYFAIDAAGGVFDTRVSYSLLSSKPFTYNGHRVDFSTLAPEMTELDHGHNPQPDPQPEPIPNDEPWFSNRGPGTFANYFPVGGTMLAVD